MRAKLPLPKSQRGFGVPCALKIAISTAICLGACLVLAGAAADAALADSGSLPGASAVGHVAAALDNPLGLAVAAANGNPLAGARFFVDHQNAPSLAARTYHELRVIADQPGTARFGAFSGPDVEPVVHSYLVRAAHEEPGTMPLLATYRIVDGHCGNWTPSPADQASYHTFITEFAQGVGRYRAVLFLEMDALITSPCLSAQGLAIRMNELHDAINVLTATCPHLVIYLDGGAADALPAWRTAQLLRRAGVAQIQGFFLNSTHFDWTAKEISYGEAVSRLTGGKHFVVNTGEGGRGPMIPPDRVHQGNEVLCNPSGRGLGPKPTTNTGYPNVDAFAWTSNPGESGGACVPGAPPMGAFWPAYALMLVGNANFAVDWHFTAGTTSVHHARRSHKRARRRARVRRHVTKRHSHRSHRRKRKRPRR